MEAQRNEAVAWSCAAATVIIFVAGLLVGVRDAIGNTNVALILVALIVAAAAVGGRLAGVTAAVVAAVSFNFFHTQPYLSLRVKDREDVITVVLLIVVGLAVGELALLRQRTHQEAIVHVAGARRLEEVVALLATDATLDETWHAVREGLVDELGLRSARFVPQAASADLPIVTRNGGVTPALSTWTGRGFQLPDLASIPVVGPRGLLGHIAIESTPGRSVSIEERRIAVALADVLAIALQRSPDQSGRIT